VKLFRRFRLVVLAPLLLAGAWAGFLWLRDLSIFRVHHVTVSGLTSPEAPSIRRVLRNTGLRMTTLHVREDKLRRAVSSFQSVRSVSASAGFPNTLHIKVSEYEPVAALSASDGRRVAVSSADTLLRAVGPNAKLPAVSVGSIPSSGRLEDAAAVKLVSGLARAPRALRPLIARAYPTARGITVAVRNGPLLYFGPAQRISAKWAAATRVLGDGTARGADVIDIRLPERPAASGFG
jgi:cell division septal protein FtsQ